MTTLRPPALLPLLAAAALGCSTRAGAPALPASIPPAAAPVVARGGLWYADLVEGRGAQLEPGQCVYVHYTGWVASTGKLFETSRDSTRSDGGRPFVFPQGAKAAIAGWDTGILGMRIGGKRRLIIPPQLAYGAAGNPPLVPKRATLVFDIELVGLATPSAKASGTKPPRCPEW